MLIYWCRQLILRKKTHPKKERMKSEYKRQRVQWRVDTLLADRSPMPFSSDFWPESELGGDGPWNNYGDDERGNCPIITPTVAPDDVPSHDFF